MIDKKTFCEVIDLLEEQNKSDKDNAKMLQKVFGIVDMDGYCNDSLIQAVFVMLHDSFPKKDGFCPIEYWCFELGFSAPRRDTSVKWQPFGDEAKAAWKITKGFDKIDTAAKLYDYLTK